MEVANRLMYFIKRLAHFIQIQYADYYTYNLVDLLLLLVSRIRYRADQKRPDSATLPQIDIFNQ